MKLSIIIPVYNEEKTVTKILNKVNNIAIPGVTKEIIVVNDGSTDASGEKIEKFVRAHSKIKYIAIKENSGKGVAVIRGIKRATGHYIVIQDADLEYNPQELSKLLQPIHSGEAVVVYGTRLKRLPNLTKDEKTPLFLLHYLGNRTLSLITSALFLQWITDMETCYKLFPRDAVQDMILHARGFEFEPEITVKLLKRGYRIHEVPITTIPRGYSEGKKINTIKDGYKALRTLLKYRFRE